MTNEEFEAFVSIDGDRVRRVLVARYGVDIGSEAADAALGWAWEHWDRLHGMDNPAGYLYRVAQSRARRTVEQARPVTFPPEPRTVSSDSAALDSDLAAALRELPERQRLAVLMVHAYGWTPLEVARITGSHAATVRSHLRRGLRHLRSSLAKGTPQ